MTKIIFEYENLWAFNGIDPGLGIDVLQSKSENEEDYFSIKKYLIDNIKFIGNKEKSFEIINQSEYGNDFNLSEFRDKILNKPLSIAKMRTIRFIDEEEMIIIPHQIVEFFSREMICNAFSTKMVISFNEKSKLSKSNKKIKPTISETTGFNIRQYISNNCFTILLGIASCGLTISSLGYFIASDDNLKHMGMGVHTDDGRMCAAVGIAVGIGLFVWFCVRHITREKSPFNVECRRIGTELKQIQI